ncbi:unnamed protein product [Linum trigynum]|uniref:Uncharacterized protein n=1 Tax=Linum trigynum TaxID=586398 RepID=A0AAV2EAZ7_9ROSI
MAADSLFPTEIRISPEGEERLNLFVHYFNILARCEQGAEFGHDMGVGLECGATQQAQLVVVDPMVEVDKGKAVVDDIPSSSGNSDGDLAVTTEAQNSSEAQASSKVQTISGGLRRVLSLRLQ